MRQNQSDRQIAATKLMGRRAASNLRKQAEALGWLDPEQALPSDEELARVLHQPKVERAHEQSTLHPFRNLITKWWSEGINGTHPSLQPFSVTTTTPAATPHSVATCGSWPTKPLVSPPSLSSPPERPHRSISAKDPRLSMSTPARCSRPGSLSWCLLGVATSTPSSCAINPSETWLGCHRRAFEHFNGVPAKIIIDNPKCAITKACYYDPQSATRLRRLRRRLWVSHIPLSRRRPTKKGTRRVGRKIRQE